MAITVTRSRFNVFGSADGIPNPVVYFGPEIDLDGVDSPVTSTNTHKVWRTNETTGALEAYVPGGGSNDFTTMDRGTNVGLGRVYVIIAKADFLLPHSNPAA